MGNDWNEFMQSKTVRTVLYAICTLFCAYYAVMAVFDIVSPSEASLTLIESMGTTGYYIMTVIRMLVCAWASVSFARAAYKAFGERE